MNKFVKLSLVSALALASISAYAGKNAEVKISGNITNYTCDITTSQSVINLGNYTKADFKANDTLVGAKNFMISVQSCASSGANTDLGLQVIEQAGSNNVDPINFFGSDNGTGAGIVLSFTKDGTTTKVTPAKNIYVLEKAGTPGADISNKIYNIDVKTAMQALNTAAVKNGTVEANLLFTMAY
ncbi:fimbrial protein [Providencia sneebia]|uniref:Fimbrial-type adhesion domain-containing protein n=1 Tax=Providencia sneebia DSM 19967 TaxID=1141660 RepID=K8WU67_9GAMM|nr:fimbrial protein [Providencia sneebia]EKT60967.1 hypothetical protein OO7_02731 [Providencia sneebia DSM 19967]